MAKTLSFLLSELQRFHSEERHDLAEFHGISWLLSEAQAARAGAGGPWRGNIAIT